jgi:hypothetical protein
MTQPKGTARGSGLIGWDQGAKHLLTREYWDGGGSGTYAYGIQDLARWRDLARQDNIRAE